MFQIRVVESKHAFHVQLILFGKSYPLRDNIETFRGAREATNDDMIWRMRLACLISKATRTNARPRVRITAQVHARTQTSKQALATTCAHAHAHGNM